MSSVEQAYQTQLNNIQARTGKSLEELGKMIDDSGLQKHGELRDMLIKTLGMGFGDASIFVHYWKKTDGEMAAKAKGSTIDQVLEEIYSGPKASLRPIHEKLMESIQGFGEFEIAPKKGYVSLRRKRQFAMLGPATNTRFELGLNIKQLPDDPRLLPQPAGGMCNFKVRLTSPEEVDEQVIQWVKQAFDISV